MRLSVPCFAKINWTLRVLGRRADGYHELDTVFQTIDLADRLEIELQPAGVSLEVEGRALSADDHNLVVRAIHKYLEARGARAGVRARLTKRIPVGGGLGGGSSDAAVTLLALERLLGGVPRHRLLRIAAELGSDVPYFLWGGLARGQGRGERIRILRDSGLRVPILLVFPGLPVSTAEAYRWLQAPEGRLTSPDADTKISAFQRILRTGKWDCLGNDLEGPVLAHVPALQAVRQALRDQGCAWVMLSGSGSTVFATGDITTLEKAGAYCNASGLGEALVSHSLPRSSYRRILAEAGVFLTGRRFPAASGGSGA